MTTAQQLAKHFRGVHFGGNWTNSNIKDQLADVTLEVAKTKVHNLNTILALTFHMGYYVTGVLEVFNDRPLLIKDKFSYNYPDITTETQWKQLIDTLLLNAETLAQHIELLTEEQLKQDFTDAKYGNYFSNINGIIEHTHYHLGQIALIKKILTHKN
ncbi:DUF1572 domain-containing protein [Psychroserpens luteus]|uniref:DUF1572 domain-containing protein n=1 Tax=Psychroserpens luteus TaxID=1434066 RepID=A0ABW5ZR26_9FLAO|nr:DUF1572 domain-containing protein [Psychroserpens luteus]